MVQRQHAFVNIFEKILKQLQQASNFKVQVTLKLVQQRQTVWHNVLISVVPSTIEHTSVICNHSHFLNCMEIAETSDMNAARLFCLTIRRWRTCCRWVVVNHELPDKSGICEIFRNLGRYHAVNVLRSQAIHGELDENMCMGVPRFWNSTEYIMYSERPTFGNMDFNVSRNTCSFCLNTQATMTGTSIQL